MNKLLGGIVLITLWCLMWYNYVGNPTSIGDFAWVWGLFMLNNLIVDEIVSVKDDDLPGGSGHHGFT